MRPRSDFFEIWILAAVIVLFFAAHSIWSILFEEWIKNKLEHSLGLSVAVMIERFGAIVVPVGIAILVIRMLYVYIRNGFVDELAIRTTPKLVCEFSDETPGCKVATSFGQQVGADYYRAKIEIKDFGFLDGCVGRVVAIKKEGKLLSAGETLTLTFAPAEDADSTSKSIFLGVPQFLDILAITEHNQVLITTKDFRYPNSINIQALFAQHGIYEITVVITAPTTTPLNLSLAFTWLGQRNTASLVRTV